MFKSLDVDKIVSRAKTVSNLRSQDVFTDDEWKDFIQEAFDELYSELITLDEGYFVSFPRLAKTDEHGRFGYPDDLYKIHMVEYIISGADPNDPNSNASAIGVPLKEVTERDGTRADYQNVYTGFFELYGNIPYGYTLFSNWLQFWPKSLSVNRDIRVTYSREIPSIRDTIQSGSNQGKSVATLQTGWENFLIYRSAYLASLSRTYVKKELNMRADVWRKKIMRYAESRDNSPSVLPGLGESGIARGEDEFY